MDSNTAQRPVHAVNPRYAGFWVRVIASIFDAILLWLPGAMISLIFFDTFVLAFDSWGFYDPGKVRLYYFLLIVLHWVYAAAMESSVTQGTLGKMALGMKVTDKQGRRISFVQASGRYFSKFLSTLIFFGGFLMVAFSNKKLGLHDRIAGTVVVRKYAK